MERNDDFLRKEKKEAFSIEYEISLHDRKINPQSTRKVSHFLSQVQQKSFMFANAISPNCLYFAQNPQRETVFRAALIKLNSTLRIDTYGECGSLELPKPKDHSSYLHSYQTIAKDYKFYLSLENSLCQEYVTEKFFNAMDSGMIPVVNGGLSKEDYRSIAPPHSYIHVDDYDTPKDLVEELVAIAKNDTLYQSYFWWKDHFTLSQEVERESQCMLCLILNNVESFKSTNYYAHFTKYWNKCRP